MANRNNAQKTSYNVNALERLDVKRSFLDSNIETLYSLLEKLSDNSASLASRAKYVKHISKVTRDIDKLSREYWRLLSDYEEEEEVTCEDY